jgi:AcrR family transcriptional regulator
MSAEGDTESLTAATPRAELERLQAQQREVASELRDQIMRSMLICCGEAGYQRVAVEHVYKRYGGYRSQFYKFFSSKADCFQAAYDEEGERICRRLLSFIEGRGDGATRLQAALRDIEALITSEPAVARALFLEVHVVGGFALTKRREMLERLASAIDSKCRLPGGTHEPPPTSGHFFVGMVDEAIANSLARGKPEELTSALPELGEILLRIYSPG